ncbi:conjugal transfer nickase/helicase domain-containing protein [Pseudomonas cedrina]|uniref:conjugal transfer nickase/helicase domain-containing protein n=1 Tax=Pseudomonas cedrina TaxID=651740 RepID=UPI0010329364
MFRGCSNDLRKRTRYRHHQQLSFQNIWTCSVQGRRETSVLNGYLIRDDKLICSLLQLTTTSLIWLISRYRAMSDRLNIPSSGGVSRKGRINPFRDKVLI